MHKQKVNFYKIEHKNKMEIIHGLHQLFINLQKIKLNKIFNLQNKIIFQVLFIIIKIYQFTSNYLIIRNLLFF